MTSAGGGFRSGDEGRAARPDRMGRGVLARALAASVLLHVAAFLAVRGVALPLPFDARAGDRARALPPAPGTLVDIRVTVVRERISPPPRPQLAVDAPRAVRAAPRPAPSAVAVRSAALRPVGLGTAGLPEGTTGGAGEGGGTEGVVPPVPRSVFPEWDPPAAVRGMEVTVRVRVDAEGRPTGEVRLLPPTPDRSFNRRLLEKARRMEYHPARRGGVPVPGWAEITFVF